MLSIYWYSTRTRRWHIRCRLISCKKPSVGEACRSGGGFEENRRTIQPLPSPLRLFNRGRRSHVGKGAGIFPQSFKPWWKYDFTNEAVTGLFCNVILVFARGPQLKSSWREVTIRFQRRGKVYLCEKLVRIKCRMPMMWSVVSCCCFIYCVLFFATNTNKPPLQPLAISIFITCVCVVPVPCLQSFVCLCFVAVSTNEQTSIFNSSTIGYWSPHYLCVHVPVHWCRHFGPDIEYCARQIC